MTQRKPLNAAQIQAEIRRRAAEDGDDRSEDVHITVNRCHPERSNLHGGNWIVSALRFSGRPSEPAMDDYQNAIKSVMRDYDLVD